MSRFAIIGAAGYVAPRHMEAIKAIGGEIVAVIDPNDSVGILDKYGYDIEYFREFERFDRHLEKLRREGSPVDYVSICSPNYLHDAHIRFALRIGAHAICEKPLVINPWNLDAISHLEEESGKKVYPVLQLRYHPGLSGAFPANANVVIKYNAPRGNWYSHSWKGDEGKSGGILANIGVHLIDIALYLFGKEKDSWILHSRDNLTKGHIELESASVLFELSTDSQKPAQRELWVGDSLIDLGAGFTNLHTKVYSEILLGRGYGIEDARPAINIVHKLRGI